MKIDEPTSPSLFTFYQQLAALRRVSRDIFVTACSSTRLSGWSPMRPSKDGTTANRGRSRRRSTESSRVITNDMSHLHFNSHPMSTGISRKRGSARNRVVVSQNPTKKNWDIGSRISKASYGEKTRPGHCHERQLIARR
jgi:hypothetical protein